MQNNVMDFSVCNVISHFIAHIITAWLGIPSSLVLYVSREGGGGTLFVKCQGSSSEILNKYRKNTWVSDFLYPPN